MRLLLRSPAADLDPHDPDAEVEIAASPDTHARRPWEWDVRLTRRPEGLSLAFDGAGVGPHHVDVRVRPDVVAATVAALEVTTAQTLARDERELWVLLVESGSLTHGPFTLAAGDVLVSEGDDPLAITVEPAGPVPVALARVALRRVDGRTLRWVP